MALTLTSSYPQHRTVKPRPDRPRYGGPHTGAFTPRKIPQIDGREKISGKQTNDEIGALSTFAPASRSRCIIGGRVWGMGINRIAESAGIRRQRGGSGKESTVWPGERNSEDVRVLLWLRYNKNHLFYLNRGIGVCIASRACINGSVIFRACIGMTVSCQILTTAMPCTM